ncbi:hypothetical protein [Heliophilum fasciatum]|uniref:Secreted protein with PEP-CTERM sorting signal n=1 Tax=Heliophilum fasciatum TaxID=35700 RepID=A0A4R2RUX8_9FIRM|nr:hypothetical protein [Heliophilum fasciatum]MCW2277185.1 divalent metal cation (Fe/Co/Zn/Cd) transporter [Heliophilum fasciatum]TCP68180.1 hypothetical protein EDD73_10483 [Heliophilum fasciatum]
MKRRYARSLSTGLASLATFMGSITMAWAEPTAAVATRETANPYPTMVGVMAVCGVIAWWWVFKRKQ